MRGGACSSGLFRRALTKLAAMAEFYTLDEGVRPRVEFVLEKARR
jgi:hypothetical protein